jgi:hypothetical protein
MLQNAVSVFLIFCLVSSYIYHHIKDDSFGSHFLCHYMYAKDLCYYRYMSYVCTSHNLCVNYAKLSFMSMFVGEKEIVDRCACVQVYVCININCKVQTEIHNLTQDKINIQLSACKFRNTHISHNVINR